MSIEEIGPTKLERAQSRLSEGLVLPGGPIPDPNPPQGEPRLRLLSGGVWW